MYSPRRRSKIGQLIAELQIAWIATEFAPHPDFFFGHSSVLGLSQQ